MSSTYAQYIPRLSLERILGYNKYMNKIVFEKTKIIAKQIILGFVDVNLGMLEIFDSHKIYKTALSKYNDFRIDDKVRFSKELYRLKQKGFIVKYLKDKEPYIKLTPKGKVLLRKYMTEQTAIPYPEKWDKKWRMVIFDIPNDKRKMRDAIRHKLLRLGFTELQESVYVFPFDCWSEIEFLRKIYYLKPYIQYIVADRIETEQDLIKHFINSKILKPSMFD